MVLPRSGGKNLEKSVENNIFDLSGTINQNTNQNTMATGNHPVSAEDVPTGAVKKNRGRLPDFSLPPPINPALASVTPLNIDHFPPSSPLFQVDATPSRYITVMKGLIAESNAANNKKFERRMERKLEEGMERMMNEISKLSLGGTAAAGSDVESVEESLAGIPGQMNAPGKKKALPPKRLTFPERLEENSDNSSLPDLPGSVGSNQIEPENRAMGSMSRHTMRSPMEKWDICFDGNPDHLDVEDFIFRVEYLQEYYRIPWSDVVGDFQRLLKNEADDWYWLALKRSGKFRSWGELKFSLLQQYRSRRSDYEIMRDLEERRQRPGETIEAFFHAMKKLGARLRVQLPDWEMIRIIKRNLRQNLAQIVYPIQVNSMEQLRDECREVERNFIKRTAEPMPVPPTSRFVSHRRQVSEVCEDQEFGENDVDEVRFPSKSSRPYSAKGESKDIICWNCHYVGHVWMECGSKKKNIFCYKCGMADVVVPECPKCSGNKSRGVTRTGESRSTQTPDDTSIPK